MRADGGPGGGERAGPGIRRHSVRVEPVRVRVLIELGTLRVC